MKDSVSLQLLLLVAVSVAGHFLPYRLLRCRCRSVRSYRRSAWWRMMIGITCICLIARCVYVSEFGLQIGLDVALLYWGIGLTVLGYELDCIRIRQPGWLTSPRSKRETTS
jgi:hypothetical protein